MIDHFGTELSNINVTDILGIDTKSKPVTGFYEPMITLAMLPSDEIFVQVYHRI